MKLKTVPKPPPQPPTELSARPSGDASVLIEWVKPKVGPLDGEVTGYQVWCYNGENLIQQKVLKLGPDATQVSLPLPTEYAQIRIEVAAMSGQVVGIRSNPVLIKLSPNGGSGDSFLVSMFKKPWLLVVTGIVVWLLLFVICVFLIRRYVSEKFSGSGKKIFYKNGNICEIRSDFIERVIEMFDKVKKISLKFYHARHDLLSKIAQKGCLTLVYHFVDNTQPLL